MHLYPCDPYRGFQALRHLCRFTRDNPFGLGLAIGITVGYAILSPRPENIAPSEADEAEWKLGQIGGRGQGIANPVRSAVAARYLTGP